MATLTNVTNDAAIDEPLVYNSAWEVDREEVQVGKVKKVNYWWRFAKDSRSPAQSTIPKPLFIPLRYPFKLPKDVAEWGLLSLDRWCHFCQRQVSTTHQSSWNLDGNYLEQFSRRDKRSMDLLNVNLSPLNWSFQDYGPSSWVKDNSWMNFFDLLLNDMQRNNTDGKQFIEHTVPGLASNFVSVPVTFELIIMDDLAKCWSKVNDSRVYTEFRGWALEPKQPTIPPPLDRRYVKLHKVDKATLGFENAEVYVEESTIESLCLGTYQWAKNNYQLVVRLKSGTAEAHSFGKKRVQTESFWNTAKANGLTVKSGRPLRSVNVELDIAFVLVDGVQPAVSKADLEQIVKDAHANAVRPIKERKFQVYTMDEKKRDQGFESRYVKTSTSPFGHYETWILKTDYISYFQAFKPYPLPDQATLNKISTELRSKAEVYPTVMKNRDSDWEKLSREAAEKNGVLNQPGLSVGIVSFRTMGRAASPDARKKEDDQQKVMGFSATDWLHRSAFSWGNVTNKMTQRPSNLIFGSSETNSIMMRYEKAWQEYMYREHKTPKGAKLEGILITMNTTVPGDIVHTDAENNQLKMTKFTKDEQGKLDGTSIDYWAAANDPTLRGLSFSLEYDLRLPSDRGIAVTPLKQTFFPFQRGFVLRLEGDVDYLLLKKWADDVSAEKSPAPAVGDATTGVLSTNLLATRPRLHPLTINPFAAMIVGASPKNPLVVATSQGKSRVTTTSLSYANIWNSFKKSDPVIIGGQVVKDACAISVDEQGNTILVQPPSDSHKSVPSKLHPFTVLDPDNAFPRLISLTPHSIVTMANDDIPNGFVLNGTVKIFNIFEAQIYVFTGQGPEGIRQIVPLRTSVKLSTFLPELESMDINAVQLTDTQLEYHQYATLTEGSGTWIQTDVTFSGPLQPISTFLHDVLGQSQPLLRMKVLIAQNNDWSFPTRPASLNFQGSIPNMSAKLGDLLEITELGVTFGLHSEYEAWEPYTKRWRHTIGLFGKIHLEMPNEIAPIALDFSVIESHGILTLAALADSDPNVTTGFAGVEGLRLSSLSFTTAFLVNKSPSMLLLQASATMKLRDSVLQLAGFYAKSTWSLSCEMYNVDFAGLRDLYEDLFESSLHVSEHEIVLENLTLIATDSAGLQISGTVTIEGHTSAEATISLNRGGLQIHGGVGDVQLLHDVVLQKAGLDISIGRQEDTTIAGPGTSYKFGIAGTVMIVSTEVSAYLYLDRENGKSFYTLYGEFGGGFSLARIAPALKGTFLDFTLSNVALIVSNTDKVSSGSVVPRSYPIIQGVQIAARLPSISALDHTFNTIDHPVTGLVLQAVYAANTKSFAIGIQLPTPRTLSFKQGTVYSGPVSLQVDLSSNPTLRLLADFFVKVPKQDPLRFTGGMALTVTEASLFAELKNQWWTNPFDLSPKLQLGPDLALQLGIQYGGPIYPSSVGVTAGLSFGQIKASAALAISEVPEQELIDFEIEKLGIKDVIELASSILATTLPAFPLSDDYLYFKKTRLYLSTGVTIGTTVYPAGASFDSDAAIFGHEGSVSCAIDKVQKRIRAHGTLDGFQVGPLSVSGSQDGTPAKVSLDFSQSSQIILVDGDVKFFDLNARTYIDASMMPSPAFHIKAALQFSASFDFFLEANTRNGSFTISSGVSGMNTIEFDVHFYFQQAICAHIVEKFNAQIMLAKHAVDDGITAAETTLTKAQNAFDSSLKTAQDTLEKSEAAYQSKVREATAALEAKMAAIRIQTDQLTSSLTKCEEGYKEALKKAMSELEVRKATQKREIDDAQKDVDNAKKTADAAVDEQINRVKKAKDDMKSQFGDALGKIEEAENEVKSAKDDLKKAHGVVDQLNQDIDHASPWNKISLGVKLAAAEINLKSREAYLSTKMAFLEAARSVVQGPGYKAAEASVQGYEATLEQTKRTADESLNKANAALQQAIDVQNRLVSEAEQILQHVQQSGPEKLAVDEAKAKLASLQKSAQAVLEPLRKAVDQVSNGIEAAAFNSAREALKGAQAGTQEVESAKHVLEFAKKGADSITAVSGWIFRHVANVLDIEEVEVTGDLRGLCEKGTSLKAHITGKFADQSIDFHVDFLPGKGEEMIKQVFNKLMDDVKNGAISIARQ